MARRRRKVRVPLYLSVRRCAEIAGCHHSTMRSWAETEKLLVHRAGRDRISTNKLQVAFPEIYERILDETTEDG